VALLGVDDLIVIDTPDALLVARRDLAQQVGDVVKALERQKREDLLWGDLTLLTEASRVRAPRLTEPPW
jgi:hypothetical protein